MPTPASGRPGYRSRYETRRRARLQRRGAARARIENVATGRRNSQPRRRRQDRSRRRDDRATCAAGQADTRSSICRRATPARCFRFADIYSRMTGGQMTTIMDPPSPNTAIATTVRSTCAICRSRRVADSSAPLPNGPQPPRDERYGFFRPEGRLRPHAPDRSPCTMAWCAGPVLGSTIDGMIDYGGDEVHLRGTLVPLYGANNLLGQLPVRRPVPRRRERRPGRHHL